jgi:hypothetical protein
MPRYFPIDAWVSFKASQSDLVAFGWRTLGITADFILPGDKDRLLRVTFDAQCIIRLVDEMPLSTEDDRSPNIGMIAEHFAYRVEGAVFAETQSEAWKVVRSPVSHYRFITGWTCMDVLSSAEPRFEVISRT